jgi:uncharacterized protein (TIGR02646 family)
MARFTRTKPAPLGGYRNPKVRAQVRQDFVRTCAYCLLEEFYAAGKENFELDHFRPKSRPEFSHLINNFYNLYYCCHPCNKKKGSIWPSQEQSALGFRFLDFCEDEFEEHYRKLPDGRWEALTSAAEYTMIHLRLNRSHLVRIRLVLETLRAPIQSRSGSR